GVTRAEAVVDQLRSARKQFDGARGLAALLLGAVVSALLVVADRIVVSMADGGLLAGWIVLWGIAFMALALLADTARSWALGFVALWKRGSERRALARADAQFMAYAQFDPRVMHELQAAMTRQKALEAEDEAAPTAKPAVAARALAVDRTTKIPSLYEATRRVRTSYYY
ncbi:MAG: hypothetical protein ABWZ88_10915, partial [Variovorax sp.]